MPTNFEINHFLFFLNISRLSFVVFTNEKMSSSSSNEVSSSSRIALVMYPRIWSQHCIPVSSADTRRHLPCWDKVSEGSYSYFWRCPNFLTTQRIEYVKGRLHARKPARFVMSFRQPSPTCRTAFPDQHLRPSGVFSCWPHGLELTFGFYPGSNKQHRLF